MLGRLSVLRQRLYCEQHGYDLIDQVAIDRSRPACWAKMPGILKALETHEWVLWADSDTLVADMVPGLEDFFDPGYDLIVQYQESRWKLSGAPLPHGMMRFHWCCIQNTSALDPYVRGDLNRYLYTRQDIGA